MATIIHREIKDELVIPLARLIGAVSYGDFITKDVEVEEEDEKGKKVKVTKQVQEKVVPPSFEEHVKALSQYLSFQFDLQLNGYLNQLANEDEEVKAKKAELEALINSKRG